MKRALEVLLAIFGAFGVLATIVVAIDKQYLTEWYIVGGLFFSLLFIISLVFFAKSHWDTRKRLAGIALVVAGALIAAPLVIIIAPSKGRQPETFDAAQLLKIERVDYKQGTTGAYAVSGTLTQDKSYLDGGRTIWIANRLHGTDEVKSIDEEPVAFSYGPCRFRSNGKDWVCDPIYLGEAPEVERTFDIFPVLLTSNESGKVTEELMKPESKASHILAPPGADAGPPFTKTRAKNETAPSSSASAPNPTQSSSPGPNQACKNLTVAARRESNALRDVQESIYTNGNGDVTGYDKAKYEKAHKVALTSVEKSQAALKAFQASGGKLPTKTEAERKFPEDLGEISNTLSQIHADLMNERDPSEAVNQLTDYQTNSNAIATMPC